ncbi:SOS response-associated peptidase [Bauldia litoralis]|uniref:SOS response-associated peptidase n=1 Tax=Bauldia litoralis TaxID=665467 RepID=UPI0032674794
MCGRYILTATPEELAALFGYIDGEWFPPRHNIAPTQPIAIVRQVEGARRFALVRWGLVPGWVEDPRKFSLLINARAEGVATKPSFKSAYKYRRCLIPASGFYEWRRVAGGAKQPYLMRRPDHAPFAFAGLWESWMGKDGSEIDSACIITTDANRLLAPIHDRMPVILHPQDYAAWLDARDNPPGAVEPLLRPAADDLLEAIPVSTRVNKAENDDPGLLEPLEQTLL